MRAMEKLMDMKGKEIDVEVVLYTSCPLSRTHTYIHIYTLRRYYIHSFMCMQMHPSTPLICKKIVFTFR